jgi:hypothetical protein
MNSTQRQALRQTLTDLGFERSSTREVNLDPEARPGEYDESWISDNADEVEIRWAARTPDEGDDLFVRLFLAVAACEAPEGTQVDDVLAQFQADFDRLAE